MQERSKSTKARKHDLILILLIILMLLAEAYLVADIDDIYMKGVREERMLAAEMASARLLCAVPVISLNAAKASLSHAAYVEEHRWKGPVLSKGRGTITGPSGKETYYNLNMSVVVNTMRRMGFDYDYWVRDDGVKMFGDYVMIAANLNIRPRGSIVETSLGPGIVCDTGGFAKKNPTQIDIATTW